MLHIDSCSPTLSICKCQPSSSFATPNYISCVFVLCFLLTSFSFTSWVLLFAFASLNYISCFLFYFFFFSVFFHNLGSSLCPLFLPWYAFSSSSFLLPYLLSSSSSFLPCFQNLSLTDISYCLPLFFSLSSFPRHFPPSIFLPYHTISSPSHFLFPSFASPFPSILIYLSPSTLPPSSLLPPPFPSSASSPPQSPPSPPLHHLLRDTSSPALGYQMVSAPECPPRRVPPRELGHSGHPVFPGASTGQGGCDRGEVSRG